ncbi:DNA polymerase III subunit delta [Altererythrobacter xixiisoli]|uniref:DNA-directed DNA polymerase n=1 Tax=Croceibacterium xixiisoli TaxID=1476466 RepID=A0A6I4TRR1_9SPHN|nr:DNA polymerase III subunit delta [Croceibacterium xixiisoli]MXO97607.1 DNA polymerase III subunit delta [Croceibacterium xixiisoli]
MKASQRDFSNVAQRAAGSLRIAFFCGQDEAGATEAAQRLVGILPEAGERVEIAGATLRSDPVLLADEARSTSLFGDKRHIWVRANGDEAHDAVKNLLAVIDGGEGDGACPVLIIATSATDKARTAKLLENRPDGLVAMFYPPDFRTITEDVMTIAHGEGLKLGRDVAERIARAVSLDIRLARSEIAKLALYLDATPHAPKMADGEALDAIGAATEEDGFMPLVNAVLSGESGRLAAELQRMRDVSLNPVAVLLAMERRAAQLAQLTARLGPGGRIDDFLEQEQRARRVFRNDRRDLANQLRRWNAGKLERLVLRLAALHRALLANNQAAELLLSQELTDITRFAAARR